MNDDAPIPALSPEPLDLLLASLPPRALLGLLKADAQLSRIVFQGFSVREGSLGRPLVRQRLTHEMTKDPALAMLLFELWQDVYSDLMSAVCNPDFEATPESLRLLLDTYGEETLRYALLHAGREEVRAWADRLAEVRAGEIAEAAEATLNAEAPALRKKFEELQALVKELQHTLREAEHERDSLRREVAHLERQVADNTSHEQEVRRLADIARQSIEEKLDREQRRARKAEEEAEGLRRQLRKHPASPARAAEPTPAPVAGEAAQVIAEALALLQRGLELTQGPSAPTTAPPPPTEPPAAPAPAPQAPPARPIRRPTGPAVSLATAHGKRSFPLDQVMTAFLRNNERVVGELRDGLARLANNPVQERRALAELVKAGIPEAVLTGPLRPAIADGSNIANMSHERRGHLAYLDQVRRSAWAEGYFPVLIIVDASLRHQIDQPDELMARVERGEIIMAPPGTSADELIIEEAQRHNAVILTNDRMADWPAAKGLEKRHLEMRNNTVRVGSFHRSGLWFPF